jgi:hypothetical protein
MATEPKDRTGEVWELATGTSFLVTGPPRRHPTLGPQHPYLRLTRGPSDDSEHDRGSIQELAFENHSFEDRGWRRLA